MELRLSLRRKVLRKSPADVSISVMTIGFSHDIDLVGVLSGSVAASSLAARRKKDCH